MKSLWNWGSITCDKKIFLKSNRRSISEQWCCSNRHLHHVPDLLRLTALYKLVKGEQALCMGPPGELRNLKASMNVNISCCKKSDDHNNHDPHQPTQSKISCGGFSLSGMSWRPCTRKLGPGRGLNKALMVIMFKWICE